MSTVMEDIEEEKQKNEQRTNDIKARIKVVCICKGIKQGRIMDAIIGGCDSQEKVNKKTGSGSGGCQATRCGPVIRQLVADYYGEKKEDEAG